MALSLHRRAMTAARALLFNDRSAVLAEEVGFEPTVGLHPRRFSRPLP